VISEALRSKASLHGGLTVSEANKPEVQPQKSGIATF